MEVQIKEIKEDATHSRLAMGNVYRCARIERGWLDDPSMPTNYSITQLHAVLFEGVESYLEKGISPNRPGNYRIEDVWVGEEPENFYVRGLDVRYLMREYSGELDGILQNLPSAPESHVSEIIHSAAWAYYNFIRIHPFLDGNGRVGRMVLQRVLKGGGFKDIIFSAENSKTSKQTIIDNRVRHLNAMKQVDKTGNLAALEVYIAEQLMSRYIGGPVTSELERFIKAKNIEIQNQKGRLPLSNIWSEFGKIDIAGGVE